MFDGGKPSNKKTYNTKGKILMKWKERETGGEKREIERRERKRKNRERKRICK